jgi:hypothetical protein
MFHKKIETSKYFTMDGSRTTMCRICAFTAEAPVTGETQRHKRNRLKESFQDFLGL